MDLKGQIVNSTTRYPNTKADERLFHIIGMVGNTFGTYA